MEILFAAMLIVGGIGALFIAISAAVVNNQVNKIKSHLNKVIESEEFSTEEKEEASNLLKTLSSNQKNLNDELVKNANELLDRITIF